MLDPRAQHLLKTLVERYIADGEPVGSRALSKYSSLELSPGHGAQRDGRPGGDGLHREPAHVGRPRPDAQGLPLLRRQPDRRAGARAGRDPSARGRADRRAADRARVRGREPAVPAHAFRRRRRDAEAPRRLVPASRVPAAVRAPRAADHRDAGRRRAEPDPAHRARVHAGRARSKRRTSSTSISPAARSRRCARASRPSSSSCARTSRR